MINICICEPLAEHTFCLLLLHAALPPYARPFEVSRREEKTCISGEYDFANI